MHGYTWILLWAEKSAGPQSGKIFRRIPKKRRRPEKTSGSKILKNRDDKRLDHTQANCLCAASSFSGAHSNLPVPIALAHLPNGAEITKQKQFVPKQRLPRKNQGVCGKEPLFLCNRVSQVFF